VFGIHPLAFCCRLDYAVGPGPSNSLRRLTFKKPRERLPFLNIFIFPAIFPPLETLYIDSTAAVVATKKD